MSSHGRPGRLHSLVRRARCNQRGLLNELNEAGQRVLDAESRLKNLMLASLEGDARAYRELLQTVSVRLRAYYRKRLGSDYLDIEDLVQETLIAIHTRRASFDRSQPFTAWAYAMARYKLIDHLRRVRVRAAIPVDDCDELFAADGKSEIAEVCGLHPVDIRRAIDQTNEKRSAVVVGKDLPDLGFG